MPRHNRPTNRAERVQYSAQLRDDDRQRRRARREAAKTHRPIRRTEARA